MSVNKKSEHLRREEHIRNFGLHIRRLREKFNYSQSELSFQSGITVSYISKIEAGKYNISLSHIVAIAEAFKIPPHDLLNFNKI